jgi:hypothetical protein
MAHSSQAIKGVLPPRDDISFPSPSTMVFTANLLPKVLLVTIAFGASSFADLVTRSKDHVSLDKRALKEFKLQLPSTRMNQLIEATRLPEFPEYPGLDSTFGIDLAYLKSLKESWLGEYDWEAEQAALNA